MLEIAIVVYVPATVRSSRWQSALEPVGGTAAIARLVARVRRHARWPVVVVCQAADDVGAIAGVVDCETVAAEAGDRVSVLARFCWEREVRTVAVFPRDALVPDCERLGRMVEFHRAEGPGATFATLYPPGLLPEIFEAGFLAELKLSPGEATNVWGALSGGRHAGRMAQFPRDHRAEPALERLPATALLLTPAARIAAGRVRDESAGYGPAIEFGDALRELERTAEPEVPEARNRAARRVLFVTMADLYAGAEESLYRLIVGIGSERYEPLALVPDHGELCERLRRAGIPLVHHVFDPRNYNPATERWFDRLLEQARPDIIHADCTPLACLAVPANRRGIPVVYHVRTLVGRNAPELMKFGERVIAVSEAARFDLLRSGIERERVVTVPNAIDLAGLDRAAHDRAEIRREMGIAEDAFVAAMVARVSRQKRQDFVLSAMPKIVERVPDFHLVLAGEVYAQETAFAEDLRAEVVRMGFSSRVHFLGFEPAIARVYAMADVLVLATEVEAFGRCIIEAMAMGVPVVVPDAAGPVEIVTPEVDGLLFPTRDAAAFADRVIRVAREPGLSARLSEAGLRRARDFSLGEHVARIRGIYDELH